MRVLVLGVGNELRRDDSVGLVTIRKLSERIDEKNMEFEEVSTTGLSLLDKIKNYDKVFIIDSIITKNGRPGDWYSLTLDDFDVSTDRISSHTIDLKTLWKIGVDAGESMPDVKIFAVEVIDPYTFGEGLTDEVRETIPSIVDEIANVMESELST